MFSTRNKCNDINWMNMLIYKSQHITHTYVIDHTHLHTNMVSILGSMYIYNR